MNKLIVPPDLFVSSTPRLELKQDVSKEVLDSIFSKENCEFILNVPNNRKWYTITSEVLSDINDKKNLTINCDNVKNLQVKALFFNWKRGYYGTGQNSGYFYIPNESLTMSCQDYLSFEMSSDRTVVKTHNHSPLKEIILKSGKVDFRVNNFKELTKVTIEGKKVGKFKVDDCAKLKEIDLTNTKAANRWFEFKLSNIPDDCLIKFNKSFLDKINFIDSENFKVGKKMLNLRMWEKQSEHFEGQWVFKERFNFEPLKNKLPDVDPIIISFKRLKELFKEFSTTKDVKEVKKRVEKEKEETKKRWAQNYLNI